MTVFLKIFVFDNNIISTVVMYVKYNVHNALVCVRYLTGRKRHDKKYIEYAKNKGLSKINTCCCILHAVKSVKGSNSIKCSGCFLDQASLSSLLSTGSRNGLELDFTLELN